ncbi:tryptophan synthase, alpha chain [Planctomicrobium piriforme]|uniref:Tryptophan synthase alpha chain n=2 Tax=Planctomicrobium piriforme TaxID=1576369 RepID=A0A1I3TE06_9PLAN|nr:tryptophan synthase, alpha chain [Planctomicrobium piriforme]
MAFMPFITAADPDLGATQNAIRTLGSASVDLIEIGFPYSDPIADGPVIQASYTRALEKKVQVRQIFAALAELKGESLPPLVAMVSYAIIFRTGIDAFLEHCVQSGISGLIVPDLPGAEAEELFTKTHARDLNLVQLIAPTTPRQRVKQVLRCCSGFVYIVAVAGTTGERANVADALLEQLRWLREETELPLAVGFGISRPEHVAPLRGLAQGVIVGTAVVRYLEKLGTSDSAATALPELKTYAESMATAAHAVKS